MKTAISIVLTLLIVALAAIGLAFSGWYDVSASTPHNSMVGWYLSTTAQASIKKRAPGVAVPSLDDEALVLAGINDYESMCVDCHGAPGKSRGPIGQGLNPPAPDLAFSAQAMSAEELFWVTKHGIRMTGMPAWGATHDDGAIWPVIAFAARLPELDAAGYRELLATAVGHGHHAVDLSSDDVSPAGEVHVHNDGSSHVHDAPAVVNETPKPEPPSHEH